MTEIFDPIAIIGFAGRFPGSADADELWRDLVAGKELVSFPSEEELLAAGVPASALSDSSYVRAVAEPPGLDLFDADFFGFTPREARLMDPQIRIFLETVHAAVENAGYAPERVTDVGVFGSAGVSRYERHATALSESRLRSSAGMLVGSLNNADYVSTTVFLQTQLPGPEPDGDDGVLKLTGRAAPGLPGTYGRTMRICRRWRRGHRVSRGARVLVVPWKPVQPGRPLPSI